jgi:predicted AlkP superfamily phosphohydrolase/phosphomutase
MAAAIAALVGAAPFLGAAVSPMAALPLLGWFGVLGLPIFTALAAIRVQRLILVLGFIVFAWFGQPPIVPSNAKVEPVVLMGIDAGTWDQINPMIENGELPNLARVVHEGASGQLTSEDPSLSPRVWSIMSTGVSAEEHGVLDFECDRFDLKKGRFWDSAAEAGARVGLMEWHITWPPDERPGFGIPGWLARGYETHPKEAGFLKRLERAGKTGRSFFSLELASDVLSAFAVSSADNVWRSLRDGVEAIEHRKNREDMYWRVKLIQARLQSDLYMTLMAREQCGFSALILYPVDSLGHAYWRWHEPSAFNDIDPELLALRKDVIRDAYREADLQLGRLLERIDFSRARLVIVSDHGMEAITRTGKEVMTARINASTLASLLGMEGRLNNAVAGKQLVLSSAIGGQEGIQDLAKVHQILSEAHVAGEPDSKPFRLEAFRPEAGTVVVDYRPSILGTIQNKIIISGESLDVSSVFREEHRTGTHTLKGIIAMLGPGIQPGSKIEGADLYDVAPTLLHLMGLEVPSDLPGRVLTEALYPKYLQSNPVKNIPGGLPMPPPVKKIGGDKGMLQENLELLGYTEGDEE